MYLSAFVAGLAHPISGADHIFAMVAVGLWSAVAGGRALWAWPTTFVAMTLPGFVAATLGMQLPLVQPGIVASIVVLGLLIALAVKAPVWLGAVIVGLFAFFHGHAHGDEMPDSASGFAYGAGFVLATALLHALGIGLGLVVGATGAAIGRRAVQTAGGAMALAGVAILAGYL